jgi:hypothetical protein
VQPHCTRSSYDANVENAPVCLAWKIVKMTAEKPRRRQRVRDGDDGSGLGTRMGLGGVAGQTQR